jgi:DMSO/TMAO reductase YedYZ molybdopterin-dependent catalytic subunit
MEQPNAAQHAQEANASLGSAPRRSVTDVGVGSPSSTPDPGVAWAVGPALLAATFAVLAALAGRFVLAWPTPAEIFADRLTTLIPLPIFSRLLDAFGHDAKHWFFGVLLLGEGLLTAAVGLLYVFLRQTLRRRVGQIGALRLSSAPAYTEIPVLALVLWLLSAGLLAPVIGGGLLGAGLPGGMAGVLGSELLPNVAFAVALVVLWRRAFAASTAAASSLGRRLSRRRLLRDSAFALAVVAGGAVAWDFITGGLGRLLGLANPAGPAVNLGDVPAHVPPPRPDYADWAPIAGQTPEVTSAASFYYVSKNLASDPSLDASSWRLTIDGMVDAPYSLSYDDLRALPPTQRYHTLECISNEVGGDLMSNALFTGVSLADILTRANVRSGASEVVFRAADDYSDRLHLAQALDPRSLIVYLINGAPLPQAHGFPARLLIPGLYGMKNGKWLTSLSVDGGDYTGYWEQQGWTREAHIKMTTRIDVPRDQDLIARGSVTIAGVAYSGDRGIGRVDVSTDGGETYHPAEFHPATLRRPLGPLTWVLWRYIWTPPASGTYVLIARAIDAQGDVQSPHEDSPLPDGASGYHRISVFVR